MNHTTQILPIAINYCFYGAIATARHAGKGVSLTTGMRFIDAILWLSILQHGRAFTRLVVYIIFCWNIYFVLSISWHCFLIFSFAPFHKRMNESTAGMEEERKTPRKDNHSKNIYKKHCLAKKFQIHSVSGRYWALKCRGAKLKATDSPRCLSHASIS